MRNDHPWVARCSQVDEAGGVEENCGRVATRAVRDVSGVVRGMGVGRKRKRVEEEEGSLETEQHGEAASSRQ
jgi:hypothetical protein